MRERLNTVPEEQFITVWNASTSLADAAARMAKLIGRTVPGWAMLSRATELRKAGIEMQRLNPPPPRTSS